MKLTKKLFSNVFFLSSSAFLGQVFTVFTAPLLTRIYTPFDYGILGVFMVVSTLTSIFSMLQYQHVIIVEKDEHLAKTAVHLCVNLTLIVSLISLILALVLLPFFSNRIGMESYYWWLYFLPLSQFASGISTVLFTWANRNEEYKRISWIRLVAAISTPIFSIGLGLFLKGPHGLIISLLLGQIITAGILYFKYGAVLKIKLFDDISEQLTLLKRHKKFPLYSLPTEFLNSFSHNVPIFFITKIAGPIAVGNFNLSNRLLGLPTQLISSSVGEIFRQKASEVAQDRASLMSLFKSTLRNLFLVSILPFLVLALFSPQIFSWVFGANWEVAGQYTQILCIVFFLRFIISPVTYVIYIKGKQQYDLIGTILFLLTTAAIAIICLFSGLSIHDFLLYYSLNFVWIYLLMLYINYWLIKNK